MKRVAFALLIAEACAAAQSVAVRGGGREVVVPLSTIEPAAIEVRDPTDGNRRKTLLGARLAAVLAKLAPPAGADTVAVRCDDGWLSLIPLATMKKFPDALIAVGEKRGGAHALLAPPRGPMFLAWPNVAEPAVDRERDLTPNGWTWGVASLEYVRAGDFAAPLALPDGASATAKQGQALFGQHCQHCHAVNGAGGMAGWDLNEPNVLTYRTEAYVRGYVIDPKRANPDGHMSGFKGKLKAGEVAAVVDFLREIRR